MNGRTLEEIHSIRLEQVIRQLENGPQVRRDRAQLERQAVHQLVHVVEQVCGRDGWSARIGGYTEEQEEVEMRKEEHTQNLMLERERDNGDDNLLHLRQDLRRAVDGRDDLKRTDALAEIKRARHETHGPNRLCDTHSRIGLVVVPAQDTVDVLPSCEREL